MENTHEKSERKVVFTPIESSVEGYFEIPGFSRYIIDDKGKVLSKRNLKEMHQSESRTSKGTYLTVSPIPDGHDGHVTIAVHRLVAIALIGPPPDLERSEINHVDGNKHNNDFENLEWVSRTENLEHAYDTGLRTENRPVYVIDLLENTKTRHRSLSVIGAMFGVSRGAQWKFVRKHISVPYKNRYLFEFDLTTRTNTNKHTWTKDIVFKDYQTGKIGIVNSTAEAELITDINRGTISWLLNNEQNKPFKGYYFQHLNELKPWPVFSDEFVRASLICTGSTKPIRVTNLSTNTTQILKSIDVFARSIGEHANTVRRVLKRSPEGCMFKGFSIAYVT